MALLKISLTTLAFFSVFAIGAFLAFSPTLVDRSLNQLAGDRGRSPTPETLALHQQLIIGDLHADSALWGRDLLKRNTWGHVDLPRLLEGGSALQTLIMATKSPRGQDYQSNATDDFDNIRLLGLGQRWPKETRDGLLSRALLQADRIKEIVKLSPSLMLIRSQSDLSALLSLRNRATPIVGALLGTEGSHALDGDINNVDVLHAAGFRIMSLHHFFDNRLGGSLHGETKTGLTKFGRATVERMMGFGMIIDVSHSSEATVLDTFEIAVDSPFIVSHTGFNGHCQSPRNISDETVKQIMGAGGLIGVGFWADVTCGLNVSAIV